MKKVFISLLLVIVVGIGLISFFFSSIVNKGTIAAVEQVGPTVTGTPVTVEGVSISLFSGSGSIRGLSIGNPEGYAAENAFYLGEISLELVPSSVFGDKVEINRIYIKNPELYYEKTLSSSNLKDLLKNVESATPASTSEETEAEAETASTKIQITEFVIEGAKVQATVPLVAQPIEIELPRIEFTNLGEGEEGITGGEVAQVVLTQVIEEILPIIIEQATQSLGTLSTEGGKAALDEVKNKAENALKGFLGK